MLPDYRYIFIVPDQPSIITFPAPGYFYPLGFQSFDVAAQGDYVDLQFLRRLSGGIVRHDELATAGSQARTFAIPAAWSSMCAAIVSRS